MRVDHAEIELAGDQEDDDPDRLASSVYQVRKRQPAASDLSSAYWRCVTVKGSLRRAAPALDSAAAPENVGSYPLKIQETNWVSLREQGWVSFDERQSLGGIGIWTMHFLGMTGYRLALPVVYEGTLTLASLMAAIRLNA